MALVDKSYCVSADVVRAIGFAADVTNVSATDITANIKAASDEVDLITH